MTRTLSKSDFKTAWHCDTRLYYRELGYPDNRVDNRYLELLAEGGYMVEQLARMCFPTGIAMEYGRDHAADALETMRRLERDEVTLFEATLLSDRRLARTDILRKRGGRIELIEVKSKSCDGDNLESGPGGPLRSKRLKAGRYPILTEWQPYLLDVTYQTHVLQRLFPDCEILPRLMVVDKSRTTVVDGYPRLFDIRRNVEIDGHHRDLDVRFIGDPHSIDPTELLRILDVASEVDELMPAVVAKADTLVGLLGDDDGPLRAIPWLTWDCGKCEYRLDDDTASGFRECWGPLADVEPHILDLYKFGRNFWGGERLADQMISHGEVSLYQVDPARLVKKDGSDPATKSRQLIQIAHTRSATPWFGPGLRPALERLDWPLHFIDFEASRMALPYHAGMHPYEQVAFQWSCHTVDGPDAMPRHSEWLNAHDLWPSREFASSLRDAIGESGRVLTWSDYEQTTLRAVRSQLAARNPEAEDLIGWLDRLAPPREADPAGPRRIFDLYKLCDQQFFHPDMGGRTGIKRVLDAIWKDDAVVRQRYASWLSQPDEMGAAIDPYHALPPITIDGIDVSVREGTAAVRAYQSMLYGAERHDPAAVDALRQLLLRYCRLDTLAMVLVWDYWNRRAPREGRSDASSPTRRDSTVALRHAQDI